MDDQKTNNGMNLYSPNRFLTGIKALDNKWNHVFIVCLLSAALGLGWFLYMYSYQPLIFSNINWIYNAGGDALQHYLGWLFYRNSPWTFPLGHIVNYGYPFGINLAYTDSIPLVAIPLKLISHLEQQRFQFIGVWVLFNFIAQIFFAILIIRLYTSSIILQIVGGSLMVLSSIMLIESMGAQLIKRTMDPPGVDLSYSVSPEKACPGLGMAADLLPCVVNSSLFRGNDWCPFRSVSI